MSGDTHPSHKQIIALIPSGIYLHSYLSHTKQELSEQ